MGRILRILGIVLVLLVVVGGILVYRILNAAGYFNTVASNFAGKCQAVAGVVGAEDIELDRATGNLFISVARPQALRRPSVLDQGGIYLAHIDRPDVGAAVVDGNSLNARFYPHGISLYADAAGRKTLAVINHTGEGGDQVMLFDVDDDARRRRLNVTLTLRRTVEDPLIAER